MKRLPAFLVLFACVLVVSARQTITTVTVASRVSADGSRSLQVGIQQLSTQADEVRIELPGNTAKTAVLLSGPRDWKMTVDGGAVRISGAPASTPLRFRLALFDARELKEAKVRVRGNGKNVLDKSYKAVELLPLHAIGSSSDVLDFPTVVSPGETIDVSVLDPGRTPADGQWIVAGVVATPTASGRLSVRLPEDLQPGSPIRVSFFDAWGERIVDALSVDETVVSEQASGPNPRITGCASAGFIGRSICVCGDFPPASRNAIRLDGQPATVVSASRHVVHVLLPPTLVPGPHTISGDPSAGFSPTDRASIVALRLQGSLDKKRLNKGQSTTLHLAVQGTDQPMVLTVTNKTPGIITIPGGNYQELATSGGALNNVERRVTGVSIGNFEIDYRLEGALCPCQQEARGDYPSAPSRPAPLIVPRRVLVTIAGGTPAATFATAQAIALANGVSVVEVTLLPSVNAGLAVFEIQDGTAAAAKVAALAADPRVTLAQPDFVYDTSQGSAASRSPSYGLEMIGADRVQNVTHGEGVRVGIIDAGIDTAHSALAKKVVDFTDLTNTGWTPDAHGTLVAGVIGGEPVAGAGSGGVAPGVQLVALKACVAESPRLATARCWSSTLARAIDLAVQKNVRVMNLSVGGPEDKLLARLVDGALRKGVFVVSAAGNDGPNGKPSFPAAFDNVIAVTAVDAANHLFSGATRGNFIDVAAPGVDILSAGPGGRAQMFSGTSAATAFGTGAVALLLHERSTLTQAELSALLRDTSRDLGTAGRDSEYGYGLLDVCRALAKLTNRKMACR